MAEISKRQRRITAQKLSKKDEGAFTPVEVNAQKYPWMTRAYRNNKYTVMINDNAKTTVGPAIRAMVQNHFDLPILNHWSELQRIKNEIFGPETTAVEYYPAESELVNQHNIYWLWIFPSGHLPKPIN